MCGEATGQLLCATARDSSSTSVVAAGAVKDPRTGRHSRSLCGVKDGSSSYLPSSREDGEEYGVL
jgi:hypothetical protein